MTDQMERAAIAIADVAEQVMAAIVADGTATLPSLSSVAAFDRHRDDVRRRLETVMLAANAQLDALLGDTHDA